MREAEVNPLRHHEIPHPITHAGALADGLVRAVERREVRRHRGAIGGQVGLPHHGAGGIDRVDGEGPLVQIDAGVEHAEGLGENGRTTSISPPGLVGNIIALLLTGPSKIVACSLSLSGPNLLKGPARERER